MMWLKLDDRFLRHPKIVRLPPKAKLLHLAGLLHCAEHLTDGFIHARELAMIAALVPCNPAIAIELEVAELWGSVDTGWVIHDFLDYNPSKESVALKRETDRERLQEWRSKQDVKRRFTERPVPVPVLDQEQDQDLRPTAGEFGEGWSATPNGWTDDQASLVRKMFERDPTWSAITPSALNGLNKRFGKGAVTTALREVWEEVAAGLAAESPFPLLSSVCERVKAS